MSASGPLAGVKVVELAGVGPGPFCGMVLADLGAEVVRVDRVGSATGGRNPRTDVLARGRRSVAVDLKSPEGVEVVLRLVNSADALIEPFRPGVAERLGVGPDVCLARNPRIVYCRMTGWGQAGPYGQRAGHDINYISLNGVLSLIGGPDGPPVPPLNLVGDFGGGAMFLALGLLAGVISARVTGAGQVVDVAMIDGAALLTAMIHQMRAFGAWDERRGANVLDGGAPYYTVYETSDGKFMSVGAIEPQFYRELLEGLGLADDSSIAGARDDKARWPELRKQFGDAFAGHTRDEWVQVFADKDACVTPVLSLDEAMRDEHIAERGVYTKLEGFTQPAPAPRFSATPTSVSAPPPAPGEQSRAVLADWGFDPAEIDALVERGAVAQSDPA